MSLCGVLFDPDEEDEFLGGDKFGNVEEHEALAVIVVEEEEGKYATRGGGGGGGGGCGGGGDGCLKLF